MSVGPRVPSVPAFEVNGALCAAEQAMEVKTASKWLWAGVEGRGQP